MDTERHTDRERERGDEHEEEQTRPKGNANSQVGQGTPISQGFPVPMDPEQSQRSKDTRPPSNQPEYMGLSKPGESSTDVAPGLGPYGRSDEEIEEMRQEREAQREEE